MIQGNTTTSSDQWGFSLIEIAVTVAVLLVIVSVAVPIFLSQRRHAQAAAAITDIRNNLSIASSIYASLKAPSEFPADMLYRMNATSSEYSRTANEVTLADDPFPQIGVSVIDNSVDPPYLRIVRMATSGVCYVARMRPGGVTEWARTDTLPCGGAGLNDTLLTWGTAPLSVEMTSVDPGTAAPPVLISVVGSTSGIPGSLTVSWSPVPGATGYSITCTPLAGTPLSSTESSVATSSVLSGAVAFVNYDCVAQSTNAFGASGDSNIVSGSATVPTHAVLRTDDFTAGAQYAIDEPVGTGTAVAPARPVGDPSAPGLFADGFTDIASIPDTSGATPHVLYVADPPNNRIVEVDVTGTSATATVLAGAPAPGLVDDVAEAARFDAPTAVIVGDDPMHDHAGKFTYDTLYVADHNNNAIRKIDLTSLAVTTVTSGVPAPNGLAGFTCYDNTGTSFAGMCLYVSTDSGSLYRVNLLDGSSTDTAVVVPSSVGLSGRDLPDGTTQDGLWVAGYGQDKILSVPLSTWLVADAAGSGAQGSADGARLSASMYGPTGSVQVGTKVYFSDGENATIRVLDLTTQQVTTLAGTPGSHAHKDGTGTAARFNTPRGIHDHGDGQYLYVADTGNNAIRRVDTTSGDVVTVFGVFPPTGVSGVMFEDSNADGLRTGADPSGIASATVQVFASSDLVTPVASTTTAADGSYSFTSLPPDSYVVKFVRPAGFAFSPQDVGADDTIDSDVAATGMTAAFAVADQQLVTNVDAGAFSYASVGDFVFSDDDRDGIQDAGEMGVAGATVNLYEASDLVTPLATQTTAADGSFGFLSVTPGDYVIEVEAPPGYQFSPKGQGFDTSADSDVDESTGRTDPFTLVSGMSDPDVDAGLLPSTKIGDVVWVDSNANGLQDTGEPGLSGVTVGIYDASDMVTPLATTTTDGSGNYLFDGLLSGSLVVKVTLPDGYLFTFNDQGGDDTADSDVAPGSGQTPPLSVSLGDDISDVDAGVYQPVTIGGRVFIDNNGDGTFEGGELGKSGVGVELYSTSSGLLASTSSDATGNYSFTGVAPGSFYLKVTKPAGFSFTAENVGSDTTDSDVDVVTGETATFVLASGGTTSSMDAGVFEPAAVTGKVFTDANGNGLDDADAGRTSVTVELHNSADDSLVASATTPASGVYTFSGVDPGPYYVQVVNPGGLVFSPQNVGADDTIDSDVDAVTGKTATIVLTSGATTSNVDAGLFQVANMDVYVWSDSNGDGLQPNESGLTSVTVQVRKAADDSLIDSATTDLFGHAVFSSLSPQDVYVQVTAPANYLFSPQDQGADDAVDSDVDTSTGKSATVTLTSGLAVSNVDAGLYEPVNVTGRMFVDQNADGLQAGDSSGVASATVNLFAAAGLVTPVASTLTNGSGVYTFSNVAPGDYVVEFVNPGGYFFSPQDQGADDTADSDADTTTGKTASFTVTSGLSVTNVDAGLFQTATVGNHVWTDDDADGIQDGGESGLSGVTVELRNASDDSLVDSTTTSAPGSYLFSPAPGSYYVQVTAPGGYTFSPQNATADTTDSDVDPSTGRTAAFTLTSGQTTNIWDAGLFQKITIGDYVWVDSNADGIQDGGESGLSGVTVELRNSSDDSLVASTTSSGTGAYSFLGVTPGSYYIQVTAPGGYSFSPQDQGADDTTDSDVNTSTGRTAAFTATSGVSQIKWDVGLFQSATIGDYIWTDDDADGIQDAGEPGLSGVTVELRNSSDDSLVASTTSAADGSYSFTPAPGSYYIQVTAPVGYFFSPQDQGADDTADSDVNTTTGKSATFTITSGQTTSLWDVGLFQSATVGDYIWTDDNADGIRDAGESGLSGVTVELRNSSDDSLVASATSAADGSYSFTPAPGSYYIQVTAPAGYFFSPQDQGADDTADSDVNTTTGKSATFTVTSGQTLNSTDAGLFELGTVGNHVWTDDDADGIQDGGESGLSGVTVELRNASDDSLVDSTTTSAPGSYLFSPAPGSYYVQVTAPGGYSFSPQDQGGNDMVDSDVNTSTGKSAVFTVTSGQILNTVDAGLFRKVTVGDYIWDDANADGIQDGGESGLSGVTVELRNSGDDSLVASTTSSGTGAYSFLGVTPGSYYIQVTAPGGYSFSPQDAAGDDGSDSDVNPSTGKTAAFTLTSGVSQIKWDVGLFQSATIGDYIWTDDNADGVQDAGESGLSGVTVELRNSADDSLAFSTTTSGTGAYSFNPAPGSYYIQVTAPGGYTFSPQDQGADDTADSDVNPSTGKSATFTLTSGETANIWDVGLFQSATIGDYIWTDDDADGIQDGGESGLSGVTVELRNSADDSLVASTTSAADGSYSFTPAPGSYYIQVTAPAGYFFSPQDQGADDTADSDVNTSTGKTASFTVTSGQTASLWDAGLFQSATIGDYIWTDSDADGVQDGGESGLSGVTVELRNSADDSLAFSTTTSGTGAYSFTGVTPGSYYVQVAAPAGYFFSPQDATADSTDSDVNPSTGRTASFTVTSGQILNTVDAGLFRKVTVGDYIWDDTNADGIQDGGESGLSGVTVELRNSGDDSLVASTTSSGPGAYSFTGVTPGSYYIQVTAPGGYSFSPQDAAGDDGSDSDVNPSTGKTATFTLTSGVRQIKWDVGLFQSATIGDYIWTDDDADGIQDAGESGLSGVTIELRNASDDSLVASTTSAADGSYSFTPAPGSYYIQVTAPGGYTFSPQDATADTADSDANPATGKTASFTVTSGQTTSLWDVGLFQSATIGDYIWTDDNADGVQDAGESGLSGVTVELRNASDDSLVASTTSAADGSYGFTPAPGSYYVQVTAPAGYFFSPQDATGDATDSDVNTSTGKTASFTVTSGQTTSLWDAGLFQSATIGDYIWTDDDADGVQDGGESGLSGVTVELRNSSDDSLAFSTTTSGTGAYSFPGVTPGSYYVQVTAPGGYFFSQQDATADTTDSDVNTSTGKTASFTVTSGQTANIWDAGLFQKATVGDYIWDDTNADGIQDADESGLSGVTVELRNSSDNSLVASTTSSGTGAYSFLGVTPGSYYVQVTKPGGRQFSPQDATGDTTDSDVNTTTGKTATFTLTSGETANTWDAGTFVAATVIAFRSQATAETTSSSLVISKPAGTVAGDVMVASVLNDNKNATMTGPAGWTLQQSLAHTSGGEKMTLYVWTKVAGASEPASYTFTGSAARMVGSILTYSGVDNSTPVEASTSAMDTSRNTSFDAPSVTPTSSNDMLITIVGSDATNTPLTAPAGMTARGVLGGSSVSATVGAAELQLSSSSATGVRTFASSGTNRSLGVTLVLKTAP